MTQRKLVVHRAGFFIYCLLEKWQDNVAVSLYQALKSIIQKLAKIYGPIRHVPELLQCIRSGIIVKSPCNMMVMWLGVQQVLCLYVYKSSGLSYMYIVFHSKNTGFTLQANIQLVDGSKLIFGISACMHQASTGKQGLNNYGCSINSLVQPE